MPYVFYVADPACSSAFEDEHNIECLEGTIVDALTRFDEIVAAEYVDLPDEEAFDAPLRAADYDQDDREDAAATIDDYISRLVPDGNVSFGFDPESLILHELGRRPGPPPGPPIEPDYEFDAAQAVRASIGFWGMHLPWMAAQRRALIAKAMAPLKEQYQKEVSAWPARHDELKRAREEWDQRREEILVSVDLTSDPARRSFLIELKSIGFALPISCCCELGVDDGMSIHLAMPTLDEHVPATRADTTKSGTLTLKRANKGLRKAIHADACQTLTMRVAIAALNAFGDVERVSVLGHVSQDKAITKLATSRDALRSTSPTTFDALGGQWSAGRALKGTAASL